MSNSEHDSARHRQILGAAIDNGSFAACVKDHDSRVLAQNGTCRNICGDRSGKICDQGCMQLLAGDDTNQWDNWGSRVFHNSLVHGAFYDVTLLCSDGHIISLLQPLAERQTRALDYYQDLGLTEREQQVIELTIEGWSNAEIRHRLGISQATLRTHLNRVYNKLREQGKEPRFLPGNRSG